CLVGGTIRRGECLRGMRGRIETQPEGMQAGFDAYSAAADGGFVFVASKRQGAAAGQRAEKAGADDAAGLVRQRLQIDAMECAGSLPSRGDDGVRICNAVAARSLLGDGVAAMR